MTEPTLPPTVPARPTGSRTRRPWQRAFGVVVIVAALALGFLIVQAGFEQLGGDEDDAATTTTTTEPPSAGLTGEDVVPDEPWTIPAVPAPVRGRAEVAGYQARLVGEDVTTDASWGQVIDGVEVRGDGASADQFRVAERLLTTYDAYPDAPLEALALAWATEAGDDLTSRATTVAGRPAWFAHAVGESSGSRVERYVVVFDAGDRPVIAVADAADADPESLQAEWLAFVSSIAPA